jgi:hypothetical protein
MGDNQNFRPERMLDVGQKAFFCPALTCAKP